MNKILFSSLICESGKFKLTATFKNTRTGEVFIKERVIKESLALNWIKKNKYPEILAMKEHI